MAKFTVTFKNPDNSVNTVLEQVADRCGFNYGELCEFVDGYIGVGEYITLQFDYDPLSDESTCEVLPTNVVGIDDWREKPSPSERLQTEQCRRKVADLRRQLDEALDTLAKEPDKTTPYALNLLKFVMDVRDDLKRWEAAPWAEDEEDLP
jgi:hypothetical protein